MGTHVEERPGPALLVADKHRRAHHVPRDVIAVARDLISHGQAEPRRAEQLLDLHFVLLGREILIRPKEMRQPALSCPHGSSTAHNR